MTCGYTVNLVNTAQTSRPCPVFLLTLFHGLGVQNNQCQKRRVFNEPAKASLHHALLIILMHMCCCKRSTLHRHDFSLCEVCYACIDFTYNLTVCTVCLTSRNLTHVLLQSMYTLGLHTKSSTANRRDAHPDLLPLC